MDQATEILTKMVERYASAKTYSDRVQLELSFIKPGERRTRSCKCETWFERPDRFRMDYHEDRLGPAFDPWPTSNWVIWRNGGATRRFEHDEITTETSLSMALACVTGVSHGVPFDLPTMLMPDLFRGAKSFGGIKKSLHEGEESVSSRLCHRISGERHRGYDRRLTLWIDVKSFLPRRLFERMHFGKTSIEKQAAEMDSRLEAIGIHKKLWPTAKHKEREEFDTEQTIEYEPELDYPIKKPVFEFVP